MILLLTNYGVVKFKRKKYKNKENDLQLFSMLNKQSASKSFQCPRFGFLGDSGLLERVGKI